MSVFEWTSFEDADALLKRDWFLDNEAIMDLLWTTDADVYDKLVKNRQAYSARIRYMLDAMDGMPAPRKTTLRVVAEFSVPLARAQKSADAQCSSSPSP